MTLPSHPRPIVDAHATAPITRAQRRDLAAAETRASILAAARERLLAEGYANLSTRAVAEVAGVPLSQIHYHFGSKQQLILAVLEAENARLLERQRRMFEGPEPLSRHWDLQDMIAAGWADAAVAVAGRDLLGGWYRLLGDVARREAERLGGRGPFTPDEVAMLMGLPFMGAEAALLLGMDEGRYPVRSALRKLGGIIRGLEER